MTIDVTADPATGHDRRSVGHPLDPLTADELRRRLPDLRITGEPAYLESSFINGIKRLPCAWG